jgi:hypothetical protein
VAAFKMASLYELKERRRRRKKKKTKTALHP